VLDEIYHLDMVRYHLDIEPIVGTAACGYLENSSATLVVYSIAAPAPRPTSLLLLGSGFAELGRIAWRRRHCR
jgi:hypothetical protein